ncbi:hypothetical protein CLV98_112106 [Dyadobacter jejuensis]|uniref:Acyltransferase-like protein n=1 Tax=Dyadobacter jejuensis TaxID=1082580 RepID=A0A316AEG0_9BACT|nr:hypothetical protein [Dyadobacter jejuensis]PWJ56011.1 hypothetical protein CLV98_112106 [Dyadobacter jejuensis]
MILMALFRKYIAYAVLAIFLAAWGSYLLWHEYLLNNPSPLRFIHLNTFDILNFGLYFLVGSLLYFFRKHLPLKGSIALLLFGAFMISYGLSSGLGWVPLMAIGWVRYIFLPYLIIYLGMQPSIWKSFDKLGDLSYGLYIYAFPVQQVLITFFLAKGLSVMSMFGLALALLLPLAWLSWTFIEKPSLKLKNKKLSLSMFLPASKSIRTPLH